MRIILTTVVLGLSFGLAGSRSQSPGPGADKGKPAKPIVVAPETIHVSIIGQTPPKPVTWDQEDNEGYQEILRCAARCGASNLFLVRGDGFREAVRATNSAYNERGAHNARAGETIPAYVEHLAGPGLPLRKTFPGVWVVACLGSSSSDMWSIKSVERTGTRIRVSYRVHGAVLADILPYVMWAPLGHLEGGKYSVELHEANSDEVKLTRFVTVEKPTQD